MCADKEGEVVDESSRGDAEVVQANAEAAGRAKTLSRRERKKLETRLNILEAAVELMRENGYDRVKVEDITKRADVANATFFLHFPTKLSIVATLNEQIAEKIAANLNGQKLAVVEKLELLRQMLEDEWIQHPGILRKLLVEALTNESGEISSSVGNLVELASGIIQEGQRQAELSAEFDPRLIARSLLASWQAVSLDWSHTGNASKASIGNRDALALLLKGALPR